MTQPLLQMTGITKAFAGVPALSDGNLTIVDNIQDGSHGKIKDLQFVNGSLEIQSGQIGDSGEGKLTCNGNSGSVTVCGGTVLGLTVGEGAYVGSGSVITRDVEPGALALGRARQENKPGYAALIRARAEAIKKAKKG